MTSPTALYDLIHFTTATTGTGTLTVGSAVAPFMTPASYGSPFNSGTTAVWYSIIDVAGGNSETGAGTYTASGTTLSRTPIISTNSNSAISLSGSARVCFTALASSLVIQGGALGTPLSGTLTNCTLPASALTGTTLASGVTASSLTSVGTLTGLTVSGVTSITGATSSELAANLIATHSDNYGIANIYNNAGSYVSYGIQPSGGIYIRASANVASGSVAFSASHNTGNNGLLQILGNGNATFYGAVTVPGGTSPLLTTSSAVTSGAGSSAGTLLNAPAAGNPTKWIPFNDNGITRYIPAW